MGGFPVFRKLVIVTRKTMFEELIERHGTPEQAEFLATNRGQSFRDIEEAHQRYHQSLTELKAAIPAGIRWQLVERGFLPNFLFAPLDLVVTLGPDGLVVNVAKYLTTQPIVAFNPDPDRIDGVLAPFQMGQAAAVLADACYGVYRAKFYTMAQARFDDGQTLYAVNDLFVGVKSHTSARYQIRYEGQTESQSSSGIIVSTGAGSSGWLRSVLTASAGVVTSVLGHGHAGAVREMYQFDPESAELRFAVREPFISRTSSAEIVFGTLQSGQSLEIQSQMPHGGVIFSDGMEADFLQFENGMRAVIGIADRRMSLVVG